MRERWHRFIERLLPWFDPLERELRDARTRAVARASARSAVRARRVLEEYRKADDAMRRGE